MSSRAEPTKAHEETRAPVPLSPAELEAVQARMRAVDELLKEKKTARFKLEVLFGDERSTWKPTPGIITFWESGSKLHGGGDAKIYVCPGEFLKRSTCMAIIPDISAAAGVLVCPGCSTAWKDVEVIGEVAGRWTMRTWADVLVKFFVRMNHDADIYLKFAPTDIRYKAAEEQDRQRGGEGLAKARTRGKHIYPLRNLLKDCSAGANLTDRLYAFLVA